jgi:dolichol-phosphate mannosyltransferase
LRDVQISLVIPVHDEADSVEPLLREIRRALDERFDYEVIFVDDGSSDGTAGRLVELRAGFPRLRVLRHDRRCGQSTAIRTGVVAARAPWIVTLDGDGQNDPADVPALLEIVRARENEGLRLVVGRRRLRRDRWLKRASSRVANAVRSRFLGDATPDTGCGLKVFSREAFLWLPYFDHVHRFLPAMFLREGWKVASVDVHHRPRERGQSKYGVLDRLWVGVVDMLGVKWLARRRAKAPGIAELE